MKSSRRPDYSARVPEAPQASSVQSAPSARADFREAVRAHHELVYRISYRIVGNHEDAEDVTQEVYLRLLRDAEALGRVISQRAWLARIAVNCSRTLLRSSKQRTRREQRWARQRELGREPEEPSMENRATVTRAIDTLPKKLWLPVVLHYQEGLKYREIATVLDCPEGTVAKRISTAKARLRDTLRHGGLAVLLPGLEASLAERPEISVPAGLPERLYRIGDSVAAAGAASALAGVSGMLAPRGGIAALRWGAATAFGLVAIALCLYWGGFFPGESGASGASGGGSVESSSASSGHAAATASDATGALSGAATAVDESGPAAVPTPHSMAAPLLYHGRVSDERGHPVVGATVALIERGVSAGRVEMQTDERGEYRMLGAAPAAAATEGAQFGFVTEPAEQDSTARVGRLRARGAAGEKNAASRGAGSAISMGAPGGAMIGVAVTQPLLLRVTAAGFVGQDSDSFASIDEPRRIDFTLLRTAELSGYVVAEDGRPIIGAQLHIVARSATSSVHSITTATVSEESGRYRFTELDLGTYLILADSPDHGPQFSIAEAGDRNVNFTLISSGALRARLSDEVGRKPPSIEGRLHDGERFVAYAISDRDGELEFADVPAGKYRLFVYRGALPLATREITIGGDGEPALAVTVPSGAVVRGVFRARDSKVAVTGYQVRLLWRGAGANPEHRWQTATVASDGSYAVTGLPPGEYRVFVTHGSRFARQTLPWGEPVTVMEGREQRLDLDLRALRAERREIQLTQADGTVAPRRFVRISLQDPSGSVEVASVVSGAQGQLNIALPNGVYRLWSYGMADRDSIPMVVDEGSAIISVTLPSAVPESEQDEALETLRPSAIEQYILHQKCDLAAVVRWFAAANVAVEAADPWYSNASNGRKLAPQRLPWPGFLSYLKRSGKVPVAVDGDIVRLGFAD